MLHDFVHGMKLKYVPTEGDGNCYFHLLLILIVHYEEIIDLCSGIYTSLDLTFYSNLRDLSQILRVFMVQELKTHPEV